MLHLFTCIYYHMRSLKQPSVAAKTLVANDKKTRETIQHGLQGTGIPCTRCVFHTGYLAHGNNKGEARGRSRQQSNSERGVRNIKEKNV